MIALNSRLIYLLISGKESTREEQNKCGLVQTLIFQERPSALKRKFYSVIIRNFLPVKNFKPSINFPLTIPYIFVWHVHYK